MLLQIEGKEGKNIEGKNITILVKDKSVCSLS